MIQATITVDGEFYQGEDPDATYRSNGGALGGSFHNYNGPEVGMLQFGDSDPHIVVGQRGLSGALERIIKRIGDGQIIAKRIVIDIEEYRT